MKNTSIDNSATLYQLDILGTGDFVMPDYSSAVSISYGTISTNGYVYAGKYVAGDYWSVYVNEQEVANGGGSYNNSSGSVFKVSKGDVISGSGGVTLKFYPLKGVNNA